MARQAWVGGNWKMHGGTSRVDTLLESVVQGAHEIPDVEFAVFPPFVYLARAEAVLNASSVAWGAQNISTENEGAFTGDISASMLKDFACSYVLVGHSERRQLFGEANETVAKKFTIAASAGIKPVLCVGETLEQREAGNTLAVVSEQLAAVLRMEDNRPHLSEAVIAYEPVWAIGTGKIATPEQAQEVHEAIRAELRAIDKTLADQMRIVYGGSVKPDNAASLFIMPDIDGALVGGASLDAAKFLEIGKQCNR